MKIYQAHNKYFCQIKVGDTLYILHDNDTIEKIIVTKNHLQDDLDLKPNKTIVNDLYLAYNNYELNYDGRLMLNTLKYIDLYSHEKNSIISELKKGYELANVFIDKENAKQFIKDRNGRKNIQEFHKQFSDYPKILVYNTQNDEVLGDVSTTNPLMCLHEIFIMTDNFKSEGFDVDIAVFDYKKLQEEIKLAIKNKKIKDVNGSTYRGQPTSDEVLQKLKYELVNRLPLSKDIFNQQQYEKDLLIKEDFEKLYNKYLKEL